MLHPAVDDWPSVEVVMPPIVVGDAEVIAVAVGVAIVVVVMGISVEVVFQSIF